MLFDPTSYFSFATVLKQNGGLFDVYVLAHFFPLFELNFFRKFAQSSSSNLFSNWRINCVRNN